jgi:hypothetical protein
MTYPQLTIFELEQSAITIQHLEKITGKIRQAER